MNDILPERIKNAGHYSLKFFVTPDEFCDIAKLFEAKQAQFRESTLAATVHDFEDVCRGYRKFYDYFVAKGKPSGFASFVYAIDFSLDSGGNSGFFARHELINWIYNGKWPEDELNFIRIFFPKGFQVDLEDEKGKYYIYEDIREHRPMTHAFWQEVTGYTKSITRPFKFFVPTIDSFKEEKPASARISNKALSELSEGWYFKKYHLHASDVLKVV